MRNRIISLESNNIFVLALALALVLTLYSCEGVFRTDPFSGPVPEELQDLNQKALDQIISIPEDDSSALHIAVISDSHYDYDKLQAAILDISGNPDIDLIIHCGDITESGLYQEYVNAAQILSSASAPVLTLIGNHDHLAFGEELFTEFFGVKDLSFIVKDVPIVLWDNTVWENHEGGPDTKWLSDAFPDRYALVFAHIPPWDDQLKDTFGNLYHVLLKNNNTLLSIHGHKHDPNFTYAYNDTIPYLVVGSTMKGYWQEIRVQAFLGQYEIIQHEF